MDKLTIVDTETGETRTGAVLPLTDEVMAKLESEGVLSSVTFDATCSFDEPGELESVIAEALEEAGPSDLYIMVVPHVGDRGYVYTQGEELPDIEYGDWLAFGTNAEDLAVALRRLNRDN